MVYTMGYHIFTPKGVPVRTIYIILKTNFANIRDDVDAPWTLVVRISVFHPPSETTLAYDGLQSSRDNLISQLAGIDK